MNAILTNRPEKFNGSFRKVNKPFKGYYFLNADGVAVVDLRIYWTDSMSYAALWVRMPNDWKQGTGRAGGWGYDRQSAAAAEAIKNAGIDLDKSISGVGSSAIEEAVKAIGESICQVNGKLFIAYP